MSPVQTVQMYVWAPDKVQSSKWRMLVRNPASNVPPEGSSWRWVMVDSMSPWASRRRDPRTSMSARFCRGTWNSSLISHPIRAACRICGYDIPSAAQARTWQVSRLQNGKSVGSPTSLIAANKNTSHYCDIVHSHLHVHYASTAVTQVAVGAVWNEDLHSWLWEAVHIAQQATAVASHHCYFLCVRQQRSFALVVSPDKIPHEDSWPW